MDYLNLPKIDLHCHLDGSVRPQTIIDLSHEQNLPLPCSTVEEIQSLLVAPQTCQDLDEYLKRFELPLSVMQTKAGIERISYELFEDAARENVKYMEVRFAPLLHTQNGLTPQEIIESVVQGMKRAEKSYDIRGNYILSIMRTMPKDRIHEVLDCGARYLGDGVVAFDLAGSEQPGFCQEFIPYAQYALDKGYRVTIHAGEQGSGQNVEDAIKMLQAERIGHGIGIKGHDSAYQLVKRKAVALETCPTSNVQTKAVDSLANHPVKAFHKDGVQITINTDNRTVSNTTMTDEVRKVVEEFDLSREEYFEIYRCSVEQSFASDAIKQQLLRLN
ncbi:adenosine deaminase [Dongshaea marina]|uniref:adenosine deaminase n=1 Tax=Dongshaea marina TaxID=2047966 RepID=UPI000D3EA613|nr:adenosine deaminase [Dongshaea marina]